MRLAMRLPPLATAFSAARASSRFGIWRPLRAGLIAVALLSTSAAAQQPSECLQGLPAIRQGFSQLGRQTSDPALQAALAQANAALQQYNAYAPQVQGALQEVGRKLGGVSCPDAVCAGYLNQARGLVGQASSEFTRVGQQLQQQQRQAQSQMQAGLARMNAINARLDEEIQWRMAQRELEQRCRKEQQRLAAAPAPAGAPPSAPSAAPASATPLDRKACPPPSAYARAIGTWTCYGRADPARWPLLNRPRPLADGAAAPGAAGAGARLPVPGAPPGPGTQGLTFCTNGVPVAGACVTGTLGPALAEFSWLDKGAPEFHRRAGMDDEAAVDLRGQEPVNRHLEQSGDMMRREIGDILGCKDAADPADCAGGVVRRWADEWQRLLGRQTAEAQDAARATAASGAAADGAAVAGNDLDAMNRAWMKHQAEDIEQAVKERMKLGTPIPHDPPRDLMHHAHGLVEGTNQTAGMAIPEWVARLPDGDSVKQRWMREVERRLEEQRRAVGAEAGSMPDPHIYDFAVGMAQKKASNVPVYDLLWRVVAGDQLLGGADGGLFTAAEQELYGALRGHSFDTLDCFSNGAQICLYALLNGDVQAKKIRLLGPQLPSLAAWEDVIRKTRAEVTVYRFPPSVDIVGWSSRVSPRMIAAATAGGILGGPPGAVLGAGTAWAGDQIASPHVRLVNLQCRPPLATNGMLINCHNQVEYRNRADNWESNPR